MRKSFRKMFLTKKGGLVKSNLREDQAGTNPEEKEKIKEVGSGGVLDNVKMVANPFCKIAAEEAIRTKEKRGGEVVIVLGALQDWGIAATYGPGDGSGPGDRREVGDGPAQPQPG
jgi:hypothetical protein